MTKVIAIDPGIFKCGFIFADKTQKKVFQAEVIESDYLLNLVRKKYQKDNKIQFLIGNGTSSDKFIKVLREFIPNLILVEEKNSTLRAKQRYFELFPLKGLKYFLPREIFILNKNLDALAALIIMEDFFNFKFEMCESISTKTWLK